MKKKLFFIILLVSCQSVFPQKRFNLIIILDDSIDSKKISCRYYNGKNDILVKDSFVNNSLTLKDKFYSNFISFHIEYHLSNESYNTNDFFINENPAKIIFQFQPGEQENVLKYSTIVNALPIYDTSVNRIFKQLVKYRKEEAKAVSDFWQRHGNEINTNDSLSRLNKKLFAALNNRTVSFLKNYSQNYFSFWYFRMEVVETSLTFFTKDRSYLKSLLTSMKAIFPKKYVESAEGQIMTKQITNLINPISPPKVNKVAPLFKVKDINGKNIRLTDYKDKYVLLDFWASWCVPCLREIPFIKQIRNEYPVEKLVVIGVSDDRDITDLKQSIAKNEINWVNIFDEKKTILNLFGVTVIPVTILINDKGVIIYDSRGKEDKDQLIRLLKNM